MYGPSTRVDNYFLLYFLFRFIIALLNHYPDVLNLQRNVGVFSQVNLICMTEQCLQALHVIDQFISTKRGENPNIRKKSNCFKH